MKVANTIKAYKYKGDDAHTSSYRHDIIRYYTSYWRVKQGTHSYDIVDKDQRYSSKQCTREHKPADKVARVGSLWQPIIVTIVKLFARMVLVEEFYTTEPHDRQ